MPGTTLWYRSGIVAVPGVMHNPGVYGGSMLFDRIGGRLYLVGRIYLGGLQIQNSSTILKNALEIMFFEGSFDTSVTGNTLVWYGSVDQLTQTGFVAYPIGAEYASGGHEFMLLYFPGSTNLYAATGHMDLVTQSQNPLNFVQDTLVHQWSIVMVTPGLRVDFYVDGVFKYTITTNIPTGIIIPFVEISNSTTASVAMSIHAFGGLLE